MANNDIENQRLTWGLNCDFCGKRFNAKKHDFKVGEFDTIFCFTCHNESMIKRNKRNEAKIVKTKWDEQLDIEVADPINDNKIIMINKS